MPYYRKTTLQFIAEAQKVHGEKLDYSEVEYVNTHTPVRIRCRRCGVVFLQSPANHLVGRSCPKCSKKQTHKRVTQEMFIARARELHGDKYDYSKTDYQDMRSSLLAFKTKWRKKGQKQVSPRQRLGDSSQPTFAQNGQKNYYFTHSLCHSLMVGCHSFAPFGGASLRHPIPRALPGAGISMPPSGRKPYPDTHPRPLPKGGEIEAYTFISD